MDGFGLDLIFVIKVKIEFGLEMRVVFDNFDFRIFANIFFRNYRNLDMYWIVQYVIFDWVFLGYFDDLKFIVFDINDFVNVSYFLNKEEF